MWEIKRYRTEDKNIWDEFISSSRNATFLFKRDYMDYHADRFEDCSLMAYRNGKLSALLPANINDTKLFSHQGLTYGGWCLPQKGIDGVDTIELWAAWMQWSRENGISTIFYKPLPSIYHKMPSEEDIYMLFRTGARLEACGLSSTIDLAHNPGYNKLMRRHLAHMPPNIEYKILDREDIPSFHRLLSSCLNERHSVLPVHTEPELSLLTSRFPDNIKIWGASMDGEVQAAVCAYLTDTCFHCQYIATTPEGREKNLLPGLFNELIKYAASKGYRYFDFGISTEEGGRSLNSGLNRQKTALGGSASIYPLYHIDIGV